MKDNKITYSQAKEAIQLLREFCFHRFKGDPYYFFQVDRGEYHTRIQVKLEYITDELKKGEQEARDYLLYLQHEAEEELENFIKASGRNGYYYS